MKKIINAIYVTLGFISLGLGVVGAILPILPTTPFLLLAAALFARGSEKFHSWFTATKIYQKYIEQAVKKKEMTKKAKRSVMITISCLLLIGFILSPIWHAKALIVVIAVFHYYYFMVKIKTVAEAKEDTANILPES